MPIAAPVIAIALVMWVATRRRTDTHAALAVTLLLSGSTLAVLLQYPALALGRPMVDDALLRADAWLGVSAPALTIWTAAHAALVRCLRAAYDTFGLQLFVAIAIVAARRDRAALWEFVTEYHLCLGIAIAACATWPATEPWAYRHLADLADQSGAVAQIAGFHARTLLTIDVNQPAGLVAMPSFHVAGAWMSAWAVRRSRPALWTFLGLNTVLTAATVLLGVHYAVDVLAGAALFVACAGLYHAAANADARILNVMALRLRTPRPSSAPFA